MFEFEENLEFSAKIKVLGVGGGGGNALKSMMRAGIEGVDFIAVNTDIQALSQNEAPIKIQIGHKLTRGLGAGANPDVGRDAALEDISLISEALSGTDLIFITAGMGGGTGTGAAPIIARAARAMGILTVGIVTKPFSFEGRKRMRQAEDGLIALKKEVDTLICIPNDNLLGLAGKETAMLDSFKMADQVLLHAVRAITDLITVPGLINLDLADMRSVMTGAGYAMMGSGVASGPSRAIEAARIAMSSPLLENLSIANATGVLLNITGASSMTLFEVNEACKFVQEACHEDANIIFGSVLDENMQDRLRITVLATGFKTVVAAPRAAVIATPASQPTQSFVSPQKPESVGTTPEADPQDELRSLFAELTDTNATIEASEAEENFTPVTETSFSSSAPTVSPVAVATSSEQPAVATIHPSYESEWSPRKTDKSAPTPMAPTKIEEKRTEKTRQLSLTDDLFEQPSIPTLPEVNEADLLPAQRPSFRDRPAAPVWGTAPATPIEPRSVRPAGARPEPMARPQLAVQSVGTQQSEADVLPIMKVRQHNYPDKAGIKSMIAEVGLSDLSEDEYDIPAFIRRRAD
jgi:cell division protein FtsZ